MTIHPSLSLVRFRGLFLCLGLLVILGCEGMEQLPFEHLALPKRDQSHLQEDDYRVRFQETRDRDAIRWLLAHRVDNGMRRKEVEQIIGQEGRYEPSDRTLKANSASYRAGDKTYAFGPDSQGAAYFLVFRENKLVGFDREDFRDDLLE